MEAKKINDFQDEFQLVEQILNRFGTPLLNKVLVTLYGGTYTQSELAQRIDTSPRSLSNTLHKLNGEIDKIILKTKNGRNQIYSLSPTAKEYVEKNLLPVPYPEKTIQFNTDAVKKGTLQQFRDLFDQFRNAAGDDWDECMLELIEERPCSYDASIKKLFQNFYNESKRLFINEETDILEEISVYIDDRLLSKKLFRKLEPLKGLKVFTRAERSRGASFTNRLIESIFDCLEGDTGYDDELKSRVRESISASEYEQAKHFICYMIGHLSEQSRNAMDIEDYLIKQYAVSENMAVFLRIRYERHIQRQQYCMSRPLSI